MARTVRAEVVHSARSIAALRARESARGADALFVDPWAAALSGRGVANAHDAAASTSTARATGAARAGARGGDKGRIAIRTKFFDDAVMDALRAAHEAEPTREKHVVFLGAGFDTRAWRLNAPNDACKALTTVFEVDVESVLREKRETMGDVPLSLCRARAEAYADIERDDWLAKLERVGFTRDAHTIWVFEGLLYYLAPRVVRRVIATSAKVSAPGGSTLVASVVNAASVRRAKSASWRTKLRRAFKLEPTPAKARWKSSCDAPDGEASYFHPWKVSLVAQLGDPRCDFGRWTGGPPPPRLHSSARRRRRDDDDVPRTYYVIAHL